MTEHEKLVHDIEGLKESIRLSWIEMDRCAMKPEERASLRNHISDLGREIAFLLDKLEALDGKRPPS